MSTEVKKNCGMIKCEKCGSIVLQPNTATWKEVKDGIFLPPMNKTHGDGTTDFGFWTVTDMFSFENVGFCNTVKDVKYLACADCEIGPIGAHFLKDKNMFYISPQRVDVVAADKSV